MSKTPDEIKRGLECCLGDTYVLHCDECPYADDDADADDGCGDNGVRLFDDALAYIKKLEEERDAAVDDLTTIIYNGAGIVCQFCKHRDEHKCAQICGFGYKGFEWRGLPE